jgi:hypothetical protein
VPNSVTPAFGTCVELNGEFIVECGMINTTTSTDPYFDSASSNKAIWSSQSLTSQRWAAPCLRYIETCVQQHFQTRKREGAPSHFLDGSHNFLCPSDVEVADYDLRAAITMNNFTFQAALGLTQTLQIAMQFLVQFHWQHLSQVASELAHLPQTRCQNLSPVMTTTFPLTRSAYKLSCSSFIVVIADAGNKD